MVGERSASPTVTKVASHMGDGGVGVALWTTQYSCRDSTAFSTPLQPSTSISPFDEPPAEALQLYNPLQPSTTLYNYTAIHPLHSTTLYSTPLSVCRTAASSAQLRGCGQGWARGLDGFRCLKNSSALGGRRKSVTEGQFRCVTQFVTQRDAHQQSLLKRFSSNRLRYLSTT